MTCAVRIATLLVGVTCLLGHEQICAQDADEGSKPLTYRRILVPESELKSQVRGLLPMKRDEFEQRLDEVNARDLSRRPAVCRIDGASYQAVFSDNQLVAGTASLAVQSTSPEKTWLSLGNPNLALTSAEWDEDPSRPASLGLSPTGETMLGVSRSSRLKLRWSAQGRPNSRGGVSFELKLPVATQNQLRISLPPDWKVTAYAGLLRLLEPAESDVDAGDAAESDHDAATWLLELGGSNIAAFSIHPPASERQEPLLMSSETAAYRISPGSLDADFNLKLEVLEQALSQVALRVPAALKILSLRYGDQRLNWQEGAPDEAGIRRLIVELSEPLSVGTHDLHVTAAASYVYDELLQIPRINFEGAIWQNGSARISSGADVRVGVRALNGAIQTASTLPGDANQSTLLQFDYFSPTAGIEVVASRPEVGLRVQSGLSVAIDATQATATLISDVSATGGNRFEITASISRRWIIDSVETMPADLLEERSVSVRGPDSQRVSIRLRHPLTEQNSVRVIVRARRQRAREGQELPADFLRMLRFDDVRSERRLISVSSTDPAVEPRLVGDLQMQRRDPADVTPAELTLFETAPGPIFFETRSPDTVGRLSLQRGEARFSAAIKTIVNVSHNAIEEQAQIAIRPESSSISAVLIRSSLDVSDEMIWTVENDPLQVVTVTREGAPTELGADGTVWRLRFQRPRTASTTLIGRRTHSFSEDWSVPLLSLPEAASQTGTIHIESSDGTVLRFQPNSMVAVPLPLLGGDRSDAVVGRFRYEPGRRAALVVSRASKGQQTSKLYVRACELRSTFSSDGASSNVATFELESFGADRFPLTLPPGVSVDRVTVDGTPASIAPQSADNLQLLIPLLSTVHQPKVELYYSSESRSQSRFVATRFSVPIPAPSVPCLDQRWIVQLAPGLQRWSEDADGSETSLSRLDGSVDLFSAKTWRSLRDRFWSGPTAIGALPAAEGSLSLGWRTYQLDFPESEEASLLVYRPAMVQVIAIALGIGLFAFMVTIRRIRIQPTAIVYIVIFCLLMVSLLPAPLSPIAWWLAASGIVAALLLAIRSPLAIDRNSLPVRAGLTDSLALPAARLFLVGLMTVAGAFLSRTLYSEEGNAAGEKQQTAIVMVPVDDRQEPIGDYVYVSEELYEALHRRARGTDANLLAWLIRASRYEANVIDDESTLQPRGCEVKAEYEIETFRDDAQVSIPLGDGDIHLVDSESTIDGQPLTSNWNVARDELSIAVPLAGRHRVELRFAVAFQRQNDVFFIDVRLPEVAQSHAQVKCDPQRGLCEIIGGLGSHAVPDDASGVVELGPASRLRVQYQHHAKAPDRVRAVSVDQLVWWKVKPGSVLADGHFEFTASEGELREITLRIDPRVKLLPLDSNTGIARQWTEEGPTNIVHLELEPPYPSEAALHASFLFVGATGSGNFVPPLIEAIGNRTNRDWRAITVAPGWQVDGFDKGLDPEAFARAWRGSVEQPRLCWDRNSFMEAPTLSIRPATEESRATEQLDYSLGADSGRLSYQARVRLRSTATFRFLLAAEPNLVVKDVVLRGADGPLPVQWWRDADGHVSVGLNAPAQNDVQLLVEADLSLKPPGQKMQLPMLRLLGVDSEACEVRLFRQPNASLQVDHSDGFSAVQESGVGSHFDGLGRLAGHFTSTGPQASRVLSVRISENAPNLEGRLVTAVYPRGSSWEAELHCDLQVRNGKVDTLKFELPDHWSGPFDIEPAVEHSLLVVPGQTRKQLVVRPQQAISDRFELRVKSPLSGSTLQTVRAPDIELLDAPAVARYLALAGGAGSGVNWETGGLQIASADQKLLSTTVPAQRYELFEVVAARFEATAGQAAEVADRPSIDLVDVNVNCNFDRRCFGSVTFNLHPAGLPQCSLAIPPDCQLTSVALDGRPVAQTPVGTRAVRIDLGRRQLPAQLEITFLGRCQGFESETGQPTELLVPELEGIPVLRSLWTIRSAGGVGQVERGSALQTTPVQQDIERLDSCLAALRDGAGSSTVTLSELDLRDWFSYWNNQFNDVRWKVRSQAAEKAGDDDRAAEQISKLESQRLSLVPKELVEAATDSETARRARKESALSASHLSADGALAAIRLKQQAASELRSDSRLQSWFLLGLVVVLLLGISTLKQRPSLQDWVLGNGWLILALSGVATWFTFPFGAIGWLLVAIAMLFTLLARQLESPPRHGLLPYHFR